MFTEGRLQSYERMMQQTCMNQSRGRDSGNHVSGKGKTTNNGNPVMKGGVRHGSHKS